MQTVAQVQLHHALKRREALTRNVSVDVALLPPARVRPHAASNSTHHIALEAVSEPYPLLTDPPFVAFKV